MSRILLLLPNLQAGGAEKGFLRIGKLAAERGHQVELVILEHHIEYAVPENIVLHALTPAGRRMSAGWLGKRIAAAKLRRWYRRATTGRPFDLIVASLPFAHEVARLAALPRVWHQVANTISAELGAMKNPRKAARRLARYRRLYDGHLVTTVSESVKADLVDNLKIRPAEILTIYNPFDFEEMRNASKAEPSDLPREPYLLHVGRFARQKRHDLLLDAFRLSGVPHRLVILTRDEDVAGINALVAARGLEGRVTVLGFHENLFPWYAHASALVLSSDFEGMPNVMIEALGVGTPVVSTDCPSGPREVLTGALQHWLVPPGDARALAERLREVVQSPPRVEPQMLERFSPEKSLTMIELLAGRA